MADGLICPHCKGNFFSHLEIQEEVRCDSWSCIYCGQVVYGPSKLLLGSRIVELSPECNQIIALIQ